MRVWLLAALAVGFVSSAESQTDWPMIGHDPGATRYSPLKQITSKNVTKLKLAWSFNTEAPVADAPGPAPSANNSAAEGASGPARPAPAPPRIRQSKTTPL